MLTDMIKFGTGGVVRFAAVLVAALLTGHAGAQVASLEALGTEDEPSANLVRSGVYRLAPTSTLRLSPTGNASSRGRGTLNMNEAPLPWNDANVLRRLVVEDVNFLFTVDGAEHYVTGRGTYEVLRSVGMLTVIGQRMTLDLRIGDAEGTVRFASGDMPLSGPLDLASIDITLRRVSPTTTAAGTLRIAAGMVPDREISAYTVSSLDSVFREGCYDPCDCLLNSFPMNGQFGLVPLPSVNTTTRVTEYALVRVRFNAALPAQTQAWWGAGIYQRDGAPFGSPLPTQRLRANLRVIGPAVTPGDTRFDSGWGTTTTPLPTIDIAIADHGFVCFNRVFDFVARRSP